MHTAKAFISVMIAEESPLIGKGLKGLLRKFEDVKITHVIRDFQELIVTVNRNKPDFVFVNADFIARNTERSLKSFLVREVPTRILLYHRVDFEPPYADEYDFVFDLHYSLDALLYELEGWFAKIPLQKDEPVNNVLSERESSILKEIALGRTNKGIAEKLHISPLTVETHRKNITRKLGIKSVSGLTIYAVLNNIIDIDQGMK